MNFHATLSTLAERLLSHPALVELGLVHTQVWDGAWHALHDPNRISLPTPAALVSMTALEITHRPQSRFLPGQLRAIASGDPAAPPPPDPETQGRTHALQARTDVAVTFVSSAPDSHKRAQAVLDLSEAALPVLIDFALQDIRGSNLYTPALHAKGLAAFVLLGRRDIESRPDQPPRAAPSELRGYIDDDDDVARIGVIYPARD